METRTSGWGSSTATAQATVSSPNYLVFSDLHGRRKEFEELLGRSPSGAQIMLLGDYVAYGPDSLGVVEIVMGLVSGQKAIALKGDWEVLLLRAFRGDPPTKKQAEDTIMNRGAGKFLYSLSRADKWRLNRALDFFESLPRGHYDPRSGIFFSHSGVDASLLSGPMDEVSFFSLQKEKLTDNYRFYDPRNIRRCTEFPFKVVAGHVPVKKAWERFIGGPGPENAPFWHENVVGVDFGAAEYKDPRLGCLGIRSDGKLSCSVVRCE